MRDFLFFVLWKCSRQTALPASGVESRSDARVFPSLSRERQSPGYTGTRRGDGNFPSGKLSMTKSRHLHQNKKPLAPFNYL
ncbi:MAG: hypothetical protein COU46_02040 [Candidatus Niyogibacteria bacterium CG10_big_fil_rev_8_21_14_0_10_42_19]|uniref:Uncharacterized protein n=1 Tax=Candidatus Niyogibacteria bacterium CG10_big_fil_rev_8_21_14_0_10_42_19 TaxID=1974725 RepID=A0A2H0TFK3_9BACT|nr:MAG: hypothetical protein COU46_02040 [Candidatus Niyogibacteria bacterium CG10_big_fil_rev_8_21_14_0_10_42_19]